MQNCNICDLVAKTFHSAGVASNKAGCFKGRRDRAWKGSLGHQVEV
jgi:hypothetical protein